MQHPSEHGFSDFFFVFAQFSLYKIILTCICLCQFVHNISREVRESIGDSEKMHLIHR